MAKNNKSYRIRTTVGREADTFLDVHLDQDYDMLEILSLKIREKDVYKLHNSDYGVVVGRVIANGNFGVPNAKISVFIPADANNSDMEMWNLYPYTSTTTKNDKNIRYNLLPDEPVGDCHQAVGTFPNKTYMLDNDSFIEVFDKYYIYTTRTNAAGDYLICGVPTGMQTLHMDLDLSDCGILSQRPRDFVYKGYTIEQFENPNKFKKDENLDGLSQIFTQNQPVYVRPFWGADENGETIGITRADIEISFKFEPTCVFLGSAISDNASNGVSKKCVPTNQMGYMEELTTGEGTIEMIRKTPGGNVEEFSIKGNHVIDGNGVWCYQIPMNLDYMMTDEYGNMVPTDDPEKGLPTRTRVRFRASLTDMENSTKSFHRAKYLIPNNPEIEDKKVDYSFGTYTDEKSFRDLFWNGVYTVKSYIPRFQKSKRWKSERFSGIKGCNYHSENNPMPYNNMRIKLPLIFTVLCVFVKTFIKIITLVNRFISGFVRLCMIILGANATKNQVENKKLHCTFIGDGLCPDMEGWYFAPGCGTGLRDKKDKQRALKNLLLKQTLEAATGTGTLDTTDDEDEKAVEKGDSIKSEEFIDETSIDTRNTTNTEIDNICLTTNIDYLVNCFEMNLAQEFKVVNFDFYNDWVNGVLYFPRWVRKVKRKKKYKISLQDGIRSYYKDKVLGCMNSDNSRVKKTRWLTQQCALSYTSPSASKNPNPWTTITTEPGCNTTEGVVKGILPSKCHKKQGMEQSPIFGKKSGLVTEETTMLGQYVYYLKPCEWNNAETRTLLFATDIVLLGTLNDCDENGLPQAFKFLSNSSYILPTNLALTTMDDDAYIYSTTAGTVCSSSREKNTTESSRRSTKETDQRVVRTETITEGGTTYEVSYDRTGNVVRRIKVAPIGNTTAQSREKGAGTIRGFEGAVRITPSYETTYHAYASTDGDGFNYSDNDDPIPITEAAGISWNYSGPGQENIEAGKLQNPEEFLKYITGGTNYNYLYYPGGHFLGLSCINSESNIKSCVNLQRICELGATMSQRREELRGFKDGKALYYYYVPTGLISNVDIEGASFRSMFATLNHNKLVATDTNEITGYKKYHFTFLRPDGFDGSLAKKVHVSGSPYNQEVNNNPEVQYLKDEAGYLGERFKGIWSIPADYDEQETDYTARRTVESTIDDYYLFRFGLNSFDASEQVKHYLKNTTKDASGKHKMPQYENSFYFYFGLHDGATALDEFKKQFFSECGINTIAKTPSISITQKISDDLSNLSATLYIENMTPEFEITIENTTNGTSGSVTTENDKISLGEIENIELLIGNQYIVKVTDSLDRTLTKEFTFGVATLKATVSSVNFRCPGDAATGDPKKGGYFRINDRVFVLTSEKRISDGEVSFRFTKDVNGEEQDVSVSQGGSYTDMAGDKWWLYYVPSIGIYNVYLEYNGASELVYVAAFEDNKDINIYVACDYMSYKPEYNPEAEEGEPKYKPSIFGGLKNLSGDTDWENSEEYFKDANVDHWLMRHTFYRQSTNDTDPYDCKVYNKGKGSIALFGQGEKGDMVADGDVKRGTNYVNDFSQYAGYNIDDKYTFIPTSYWSNTGGEDFTGHDYRNTFDIMSYTSDGRAAADASACEIGDYSYSVAERKITMALSNNDGTLKNGHGCIVVFENGTVVFPIVNGDTLEAYSSYSPYPDGASSEILKMATVYPTMKVPVIYKPFYAKVSALTWDVQSLYLPNNQYLETVPEKLTLPLSFKFEGDIYNGLTWNNHFYSAETTGSDAVYETFLNFNTGNDIGTWSPKSFWEYLTNSNVEGLLTEKDYEHKRKAPTPSGKTFGFEKWEGDRWALGREITSAGTDDGDILQIIYAITEGMPDFSSAPKNIKTGSYTDGNFGLWQLSDSCNLNDAFYNTLKIKALDENLGLTGPCALYIEGKIPEGLSIYATTEELFNKSVMPLYIEESGKRFFLGTYNENVKYDKKGTKTTVVADRGKYKFSVTQENGSVVQKKTKGGVSGAETELYGSGITLLHQYTLKNKYKVKIAEVNDVISGATPISVDKILSPTNQTNYEPLNPGSAYTIIGVYKNPEPEGSKNDMYVIKLYPVGTLDVLFPASEGGVLPYMTARETITFNKNAQTVVIPVTTNVKFSVIIDNDADWIEYAEGYSENTIYDAGTISISLVLSKNESGADRRGHIRLHCEDDGVELIDYEITIVQTKDDIKPLEEEIEELRPPVSGRT